MIQALGTNGSIQFDGRFVTVQPKGGLIGAFSGKSAVRLPLKSIASVEWGQPTAMKNGYIRICTNGMMPLQGTPLRPAFMDAGSDPNSIVFARKHLDQFSAFRDELEEALVG